MICYILIKVFDKTCTLHVCLIGDEIEYIDVCMCIHACICTYIYVYLYVYGCMCVNVCLYMCIIMYLCLFYGFWHLGSGW